MVVFNNVIEQFDKKYSIQNSNEVETIKPIDQKHEYDILLSVAIEEEDSYLEIQLFDLHQKIKNIMALRYINESNSTISILYQGMFVFFYIHCMILFHSLIFDRSSIKMIQHSKIISSEIVALLGTIGTFYSIAVAINHNNNVSEALLSNFYDAIFTTIVGLSLSVIIVFTSFVYIVFHKKDIP
jgi:multisubunit Na+/H+ antiporter MnhC subunit